MSIRPLSKELQAKAEKELFEKPDRIKEDIAYIKEWLKKQPHINARTDDQWLLTFLRGCKFSLERTKEKLDTFYTMRAILPEFFKNRDPLLPELQKVLKLGLFLPLPISDTPDSPNIILLRQAEFDPTIDPHNIFKVNMMLADIQLLEDDKTTICGMVFVQDMKGLTMNHLTTFTPAMAKKAMTTFQTGYPNRQKGGHFINIPSFFEMMYSMFRPFLSEKLRNRMKIHTGDDLTELYKDIPQRLLPKEYGGEAGTIEELTEYWKKKVESYRDWFLDDEQYKTDEKKRPGKPKTSDNVFGIEGSFRKLNVD